MTSSSVNVSCQILGWAALVFASMGCAQSADSATSERPASSPANLSVLSKAVAPTLATVKPPGNPTINHHFISEKKLAELPVPQQSPELAQSLAQLETGSLEERKARLKAKVIADMVYVQGGSFMRGDFAKLLGIEGVTRMTYNEDDKVVKEITLSDFWISKYKATYAEFDVFTDATSRARTGMEYGGKYRYPTLPARAYWQEAKDYCLWLGQLTGLPIDLPTEAQWEYAARSRGQFFMIPTDDGTIEFGRNLPYAAQAELISPVRRMDRYPVGLFLPNPMGVYDMGGNGKEWVNDWYAVDAYANAPVKDPRGPSTAERKVTRSWGSDTLKIGVAVWRRSDLLIPMGRGGIAEDFDKLTPVGTEYAPSLRCVVTPH